jgi:hypothetical protein
MCNILRHNARVKREEELYSLRQTHYATALAVAENYTKSAMDTNCINDHNWRTVLSDMSRMKDELTRVNLAHHATSTKLVGATVQVAKLRAETARETNSSGSQSHALLVERVAKLERQATEDARHRRTTEAALRDEKNTVSEMVAAMVKRDKQLADKKAKIDSLRRRLTDKTDQSEVDQALNVALKKLLETRKRRSEDLSSDDEKKSDDTTNKRERRESGGARDAAS